MYGTLAGKRSQALLILWALFLILCGIPLAGNAQSDSASPPQAPKPRLTEEEAREGWKLLFDGETTVGWRGVNTNDFPYQGWTVENGHIRTLKPAYSGDIITTDTFKNFDLRFEWLLEKGGNSGVKYLVAEGRPEPNILGVSRSKVPRLVVWAAGLFVAIYVLLFRRNLSKYLAVRVLCVALIALSGFNLITGSRDLFDHINSLRHSAVGLEYQVLDDPSHPMAKNDPTSSAGSLYILVPASAEKELYSDGRFNEGRIVVQGQRVEHWLNGKKVLEYRLDDPELASRVAATKFNQVPNFLSKEGGHIALQHHHDAVWFKNIKIRELPEE